MITPHAPLATSRPMHIGLVALVAVLPLWVVELPPMVDLPNHLARIHVLLDLLAGGAHFGDVFQAVMLPLPNVGADLVLLPLAAVVGAETAGKLYVSGVLVFAAWAQARFLRAAGAPEAGWLVLPLLWTWFVHMGFLSFALSLPLALWAWAQVLARGDGPVTARQRAAFAALATATYLSHLASFAVLIAAVQLTKGARRGWRGLFAVEVGFLPGLACFAAIALLGEAGTPGKMVWPPLEWKLGGLATMFFGFDWKTDLLVFGGIVAAVAAGVVALRPVWLGASALAHAAFLILPLTAFGGSYVDTRTLPFALILVLAAFRYRPRVARAAGLAMLVVTVGYTTLQYRRVGAEVAETVHAAAAVVPPNARVARIAAVRYPARVNAHVHAACWLTIRKNAVTQLFALPLQQPIRWRTKPAGRRAPPAVLATSWDYAWLTRRKPELERALEERAGPVVTAGPLRLYPLAPWRIRTR